MARLTALMLLAGLAAARQYPRRAVQADYLVDIGSISSATFCQQWRQAALDIAAAACHHHETTCEITGTAGQADAAAFYVPFKNNTAGQCNTSMGPASGPKTDTTQETCAKLGNGCKVVKKIKGSAPSPTSHTGHGHHSHMLTVSHRHYSGHDHHHHHHHKSHSGHAEGKSVAQAAVTPPVSAPGAVTPMLVTSGAPAAAITPVPAASSDTGAPAATGTPVGAAAVDPATSDVAPAVTPAAAAVATGSAIGASSIPAPSSATGQLIGSPSSDTTDVPSSATSLVLPSTSTVPNSSAVRLATRQLAVSSFVGAALAFWLSR